MFFESCKLTYTNNANYIMSNIYIYVFQSKICSFHTHILLGPRDF